MRSTDISLVEPAARHIWCKLLAEEHVALALKNAIVATGVTFVGIAARHHDDSTTTTTVKNNGNYVVPCVAREDDETEDERECA